MERLLFHTLPPELNRMLEGYCAENITVERESNGFYITFPCNRGTESYWFSAVHPDVMRFLNDIKTQKHGDVTLDVTMHHSGLTYCDGIFIIYMSHRRLSLDKHSSAKILEQLYKSYYVYI